MLNLLLTNTLLFELFARGGGGGSGGGGGGGGGGGSVIALIGYLPTYYTTKLCYKVLPKLVTIAAGSVVGLIVTGIMASLNGTIGFIVGIGAIAGVWAGLTDLHGRIAKKGKLARKSLSMAAASDPMWNEEALRSRVAQTYQDFQKDWSTFNLEHMKTYLSPAYYAHIELMLKALYQMGRQNSVWNPELLEQQVIEINDQANNDHDKFTTYIEGRAMDQLIDMKTNEVIYTDNRVFEEFWKFDRSGNVWVLEGIDQATANQAAQLSSLSAFASSNGMYYSLDWGWLLLPSRGQLFGKANFKKSDVNNHVIGEWAGLLVQLYTYIPVKSNSSAQNYLIAQINLPKSYGGIIIKKRRRWELFNKVPKGYQKISFEWPDFNKRYRVYATDVDQVTSFELLNPAFMAELYDFNLPVNIEVVDNVVYLYAQASNPANRYEQMMAVLQRAFRELKR